MAPLHQNLVAPGVNIRLLGGNHQVQLITKVPGVLLPDSN